MNPIERMSYQYRVKKLGTMDVPEIYKLCQGNPLYYEYMKEEVSIVSIQETLRAVPKNISLDNKLSIGFYNDNTLIAILDLIIQYPKKDSAYIGWFMMCKELHKKGIASEIIQEVLEFLRLEKYKYVELAYIKNNIQAEKFWTKNGFISDGIEIDKDKYMLVILHRQLV